MLRTVLYHQGGSSFTEDSPMDTLQACAKAFENLLPIKYHILIGRKGKSVDLTVSFEAVEFHHLVGLHKLHDLRIARANREKVFSRILSGDITLEDVKGAATFPISRNGWSLLKRLKCFLTKMT